VLELADKEKDHFNLNKLLDDKSQLLVILSSNISFENSIIKTKKITNQSSITDILTIALEREKATFNTYNMFLKIANMNGIVIGTFKLLKLEEKKHMKSINKKLKKISND